MTGEEMKGDKREKSVEVDTDLSGDHEGLKPIPKAPKNRSDESPKPPRVPRTPKAETNAEETSKKGYSANGGDINKGEYPEIPPKRNENKKEIPPETKQDSGISRRNNKHSGKLDLEGPSNPVDKKTARWIEEQNEFLGKQKEKGSDRDKKERDAPKFSPNGLVKVLQRPRTACHTGYERPLQHLMGAQRGPGPTTTYEYD